MVDGASAVKDASSRTSHHGNKKRCVRHSQVYDDKLVCSENGVPQATYHAASVPDPDNAVLKVSGQTSAVSAGDAMGTLSWLSGG